MGVPSVIGERYSIDRQTNLGVPFQLLELWPKDRPASDELGYYRRVSRDGAGAMETFRFGSDRPETAPIAGREVRSVATPVRR